MAIRIEQEAYLACVNQVDSAWSALCNVQIDHYLFPSKSQMIPAYHDRLHELARIMKEYTILLQNDIECCKQAEVAFADSDKAASLLMQMEGTGASGRGGGGGGGGGW